jgi:hypothetical protein
MGSTVRWRQLWHDFSFKASCIREIAFSFLPAASFQQKLR